MKRLSSDVGPVAVLRSYEVVGTLAMLGTMGLATMRTTLQAPSPEAIEQYLDAYGFPFP